MSNGRPLRVLLVTRNLPPLVGGMERLNWHMAEELARTNEVRIVGPQGAAALAPSGIELREVPLRPLWKFLLGAWRGARREAVRWRPDVVLAGSGLTAPIARAAAHLCGATTVVYVHGLDVAVRHLLYRAFWLRAIRCADRVVANSGPTAVLCHGIGVDSARVGIVHPGVDLPLLPTVLSTPSAAAFRARHGLGNRPLLLSVGRLSTRKGLREFVAHSLPRIVAEHLDALLLVVGDEPKNALHAQAQTPDSIRATAERAGVAAALRFLGTITDYTELEAVYCAADVHVFPVRNIPGDPEGFGMVAVEAAAHGLPTVAFATGGIVDAVAEGRSGHLVAPGDYAGFADAVMLALRQRDDLRPSCMRFSQQFAWSVFGSRLSAELVCALNPAVDGL